MFVKLEHRQFAGSSSSDSLCNKTYFGLAHGHYPAYHIEKGFANDKHPYTVEGDSDDIVTWLSDNIFGSVALTYSNYDFVTVEGWVSDECGSESWHFHRFTILEENEVKKEEIRKFLIKAISENCISLQKKSDQDHSDWEDERNTRNSYLYDHPTQD